MNHRVARLLCLVAMLLILGGCRSAPGATVRRSEFDNLSHRVTNLETSVSALESKHPDLPRAVSGPLDALSSPGGSTGNPPVASTKNIPVAAAPTGSERGDYNRGQSLLKQKKYDQAAAVFSQMLLDYPAGSLAPNAAYWLGESYYASGRYSEAAAAFDDGATRYPQSDKAPDALLKLACSYDRMNDNSRAMAVMDMLLTTYPNSRAAKMYYDGEGCFRN